MASLISTALLFAAHVSCTTTPPSHAAQHTLFGNSFGVPGKNATYDYVVVGGGTGGNAIAARLAQAPGVSVAVIEAGSFYQADNGNGSVIPALATTQYVGTSPDDTQPLIDWNFVTTPQAVSPCQDAYESAVDDVRARTTVCYIMPEGKRWADRLLATTWPIIGKMSDSPNVTFLIRSSGTIGSYQAWADEVGDQSYTFENLLPYFKKGVSLTPPDNAARVNGSVTYDPAAFSPTGGPLSVWWPNYASPFDSYATKALAAIGVQPQVQNFQSGSIIGSAWTPSTIDPKLAHRDSSATSYLKLARETTNIKIYTQALAKEILFGPNNTATGVLVNTGGKPFSLMAKKEVILAAGAFQSPQMLMVSGIGPAATLRQHNIAVRKDLPGVGQNLWDQPLWSIAYRVNVLTSSEMLNNPSYAAATAEQYLQNQTGPLTIGPSFLAFENLPEASRANFSASTREGLSKFPADWPEVEYLFQEGNPGNNTNYMESDPRDGYNYASIAAAVIAPSSRGNVTISSADMAVPPVINPNYLSTEQDSQVAIAAFKRVRAIFANMPITIGEEYYPGPSVQTDEEILNQIHKSVTQLFHAAATCKMGKSSDPLAVVDTQARVFGTNSLRVVDLSAFPFLTPGHPQSGVYMFAEKIADDILSGR